MDKALTTLWIRLTARNPTRQDRGASLVEYGLLVALIAIVCLTAVFFLGDETSEEFHSIGSSINSAT